MDAHKIIYSLCCAAVGAGLGCYGMSLYYGKELGFCKENKELMEVIDAVDESYYKEIDTEKLKENIINGYIDGIGDRYTVYNTSDELTEQAANQAESTLTMGFHMSREPRTWNILLDKVKKGSPAEKAGLMTGDIIYEVNGRNVREEGYYNVLDEMTGKEGKKLALKIIRDGRKTEQEVTLENTRDNKQELVSLIGDDIVYYRSRSFGPYGNIDAFTTGVAEIRSTKDPHKLIIDLRGNGGGDPESPVTFFDMFDDDVSTVRLVNEKTGEEDVYTTGEPSQYKFDTVVLVSDDTFSSAETLAALFKDKGLATLVGTTTGGKGVYQKNCMFGGIGDLVVVEGYYYVNDIPNFNGKGIEPDVVVEMDPDLRGTDEDIQLQKAIELLG